VGIENISTYVAGVFLLMSELYIFGIKHFLAEKGDEEYDVD